MRLRPLLCVLLLAARGFAAEPAAESAPAADAKLSQAKARYEQGVEAYASGRFKDAVDLFLDADRMSPSAPLSFNIARAYEKLGDDSGALRWYRDYLRRAPTASNAKAVGELVQRFEGRLAKKGVQQLTVLSTPTGATVAIDETPVGVTPWTGDLTPGKHKVGLTLRGYVDTASEVEVALERAQDLSLELPPAPATPDAPPPVASPTPEPALAPAPVVASSEAPAEAKPKGLGVWPWVTLGAGGVALGAGLVFELLRSSSEQAAEEATTQIEYKEELDNMESRRTTARVLVGVGGALVIVGGTLLVFDYSAKKKRRTALRWSVSPERVEAAITGSF